MLHIALALALSTPIHAEGSDPNAAWYQSLDVPGTRGASCCNMHDCHTVPIRIQHNPQTHALQRYVYIDEKSFPNSDAVAYEGHAPNDWVRVPEETILYGRDNPTGETVACWSSGRLLCVVLGPEI